MIDPGTGTTIASLPVRDDAGMAAVAWSAAGSGGRLFVLDGDTASRLRVLDPATLGVLREVRFEDRVLRFNDRQLLHASRDGHWLFVYTHRYRDTAWQLRAFNVDKETFDGTTIPNPGCPNAVLASVRNGTVFALCPGRITAFTLSAGGEATIRARTALPLAEILAAEAAPDGSGVYAVGIAEPGAAPVLLRWRIASETTVTRPAAEALVVPEQALRTHRQFTLLSSRDGAGLALVHASRIWVLDSEFRVSGRFELPSEARGVGLDPIEDELLTLHAPEMRGVFRLIRTPLRSGRPVAVGTSLPSTNAPVAFSVGVVNGTR